MDLELVRSVFEKLRIPPPSKLVLLEAETLQSAHVPFHPPDCPALLTGVSSRQLAAHLGEVLLAYYPGEHELFLVDTNDPTGKSRIPKAAQEKSIATLHLGDLAADQKSTLGFSRATCLYIPALDDGTSFESFAEIVAHLRAPNGCPWDREQTHESLRPHLLEETYETLAAIDSGDFASMREEFGDLLLQVVLQTQIAAQADHFRISQVLKGVHDKLVRRHPHVFGEVEVGGVGEVLTNWEKLKEQERGKKKDGKGLLDGLPAALPALTQAQEYQDRAARVGFDWPEIEGVLDKIAEEIREVKATENPERLAEELGDLLFALVNLARWKKVEAESALRAANMKFKNRFGYVEQNAKAGGRNLSELSLEEMELFWKGAKRLGL
jgi:tetrapyrrole methylase family protein/MazG family protein